jgi:predicted porin
MMGFKATLLAAVSVCVLAGTQARADDYTDLLDILRAKGSLSNSEYRALMAKHMHGHGMARRHVAPGMETAPAPDEAAAEQARQSAIAAAASAAAAQADLQKSQAMMTEMTTAPDVVHMEPYKPGSGVTVRVGAVDLNFSGIVNGYYTYSAAGGGAGKPGIGGALADGSGFDSSSVRNGLLPGAFIFTASTTQEGIDVSAVFGVFPGIDSSVAGALGANSGGNSTALGTAGGDFRKMYLTFGTKDLGTIKIGRDIGIFGSDAILDDATLLSVGATGGNAEPGNTSLGRIGLGYIYTDFMPQITYISPIFGGFQATLGVFQPLNAFDFAGGGPNGNYSATSNTHAAPLFEGKLTYDLKMGDTKARVWAGFMTQTLDNIVLANGLQTSDSQTGVAGEVGAKVDSGPFGVTGYYYRGRAVGTTGKFFDALAENGDARDSEGFYVQGSVKIVPKFKLVASYGESSLYQAPGEDDPLLVSRNEAYVGAGYYTLTDWVTLVGEYAHQKSDSHSGYSVSSDAITAGAILFY